MPRRDSPPHRPALQAGALLFGHAAINGVSCGSRTRSSRPTTSRAPGTLTTPSLQAPSFLAVAAGIEPAERWFWRPAEVPTLCATVRLRYLLSPSSSLVVAADGVAPSFPACGAGVLPLDEAAKLRNQDEGFRREGTAWFPSELSSVPFPDSSLLNPHSSSGTRWRSRTSLSIASGWRSTAERNGQPSLNW